VLYIYNIYIAMLLHTIELQNRILNKYNINNSTGSSNFVRVVSGNDICVYTYIYKEYIYKVLFHIIIYILYISIK
jgi:hypothetical protein